jgi:hypothetical protein
MEEDDEERGFISSKDFMTDFATDDFMKKNIRVRPKSGRDIDENNNEGNASRVGGDGDGNDDD